MDNAKKQLRIYFVIGFVVLIGIYFTVSIYTQQQEFNEKHKQIEVLKKKIEQLEQQNKLLSDPEYIKNEFRKKYNLIEKDEKIINFPNDKSK